MDQDPVFVMLRINLPNQFGLEPGDTDIGTGLYIVNYPDPPVFEPGPACVPFLQDPCLESGMKKGSPFNR